MKWLKAVGLVASIVLFFVILWLNSFYWSSLARFRDWLFSPNELGRFLWESLTGPPAAGALAVTAAWIAYTGIKKQVAEQKAANANAVGVAEETKRKNHDDQWWKTLEWAYEQATKPGVAGDQFKANAVVGILEAITTKDLTPMQLGTLNNLRTIFETKNTDASKVAFANWDRVLQAAIAGEKPRGRRQTTKSYEYKKALSVEMDIIAQSFGLKRVVAIQQGAPLLYRTKAGSLIGLEPMYIGADTDLATFNPRVEARSIRDRLMERKFVVSEDPPFGDGELEALKLVVIVTNMRGYWTPANKSKLDPHHIYYPEGERARVDEEAPLVSSTARRAMLRNQLRDVLQQLKEAVPEPAEELMTEEEPSRDLRDRL